MHSRPKIAIIGGGASALYLGCELGKFANVHVYEQNASLGKKFLVAGKGGFNISHHHDQVLEMSSKYQPVKMFDPLILKFTPTNLRDWYAAIGIETFIGSSDRIFPTKTYSPGDVLRAIKQQLKALNVQIHLRHKFVGFDTNSKVLISAASGVDGLTADFIIFCLGGGSWKVTGANDKWLSDFERLGISVLPFQSSNCGLNIIWPESVKNHHQGKPLKNISISFNGIVQKGEAVLTDYGLEGNAIYPISSRIRKHGNNDYTTQVLLNLKPHNTRKQLINKMKMNSGSKLRDQLNLDGVKWALFKNFSPKEAMENPIKMVHYLQNLPIKVEGLRPIEEAISTVGGIELNEIDENFELKKLPSMFIAGEMLNWDAPTGGYLLHGCFAIADHISKYLINKTVQ